MSVNWVRSCFLLALPFFLALLFVLVVTSCPQHFQFGWLRCGTIYFCLQLGGFLAAAITIELGCSATCGTGMWWRASVRSRSSPSSHWLGHMRHKHVWEVLWMHFELTIEPSARPHAAQACEGGPAWVSWFIFESPTRPRAAKACGGLVRAHRAHDRAAGSATCGTGRWRSESGHALRLLVLVWFSCVEASCDGCRAEGA